MTDQMPMRCGDLAPYLAPFADGELAEPLRTAVAAHIAGCEECALDVQRYQRIDALLATLPSSPPTRDLLPAILDGAHTRQQAGRSASPQQVDRVSSLRRTHTVNVPPPLELPIAPARRSRLPYTVVPALVAVVLIAVTLSIFHSTPATQTYITPPAATPTLAAGMNPLAQSRAQMLSQAGQLAFAPVAPTYLPPSTRLLGVTVGRGGDAVNQRSLDVTWSYLSPGTVLHLREVLVAQGASEYVPLSQTSPLLAWQVGASPWRPVRLRSAPARLAISEQRADLLIVIDAPRPADATALDEMVSTLRLLSLSLDTPYAPRTLIPVTASGKVLSLRAHGTNGRGESWTSTAYLDMGDGTQPVRSDVTIADGSLLYRDVSNASGAVRLDEHATHYAEVSADQSAIATVTPDASVTQIFFGADTLARSGQLWDTGTATYAGRTVDDYRLVSAPRLTHVYVDPAAQQVLAVVVDETAGVAPGGATAPDRLASRDGCVRYTQLAYMTTSALPVGTFDATPPATFTLGTVPHPTLCG